MNKITLSGYAGTGKSTVGNILKDKLNYEFVSVGNFSREYAQKEYGLTINEFQEKCKKKPNLDDLIDEKFKQLCNEKENIVADYRLGFHFVKNTFNVLLKVLDKVAAERIQNANREKESTDIESIKKRNQEMKQRFINKYGVDFTNENNYDLVIDTDNLTPENIAGQIISQIQNIEKIQLNLKEENPKFNWTVTNAEITFKKDTKELIRYKLFSKDGTEQAHSIKIKNNTIDYWHLEIVNRYGYPIEHIIQDFVGYYYEVILNDKTRAKIESALPRVWYRMCENHQLYYVGYAMIANKLQQFSPLFGIYFQNGYISAINDSQYGSKDTIFPTPVYPEMYVLQEFNSKTNKEAYHEEEIKDKTEKTIVFNGFNEYETKYFVNSEAEKNLQKYGFFIPELRNIINNSDLLLKYIPTVNYHLIKPCNMKCKHCFSDYSEIEINSLPFEKAKQIIQEIAKIKSFKKLNFSGGEPTMFKGIEQLIEYAKEQGLETSMVTNGYNLVKSPKLLDKLKGNLDLLALSIDSFDPELNLKIGRHVGKQTIPYKDFLMLTEKCLEYGIKIKVNTVVTKLNYNQLLANEIAVFKPIRWKILKMLPVKNQNDKAQDICPSDEEFDIFVKRNKEIAEQLQIKIVTESNEDMTGSYLMISPDGNFFNNVDGSLNYSDSILSVGLDEALKQTPLRREIFYKREGDYSCD
jgi:predicted cytidylate kinase